MNPYVIIGVIGALTLSHGAAYLKGRADVSDKARIERLEAENAGLRDDLAREEAARKADALQALQDRKDADLDADFAEELRNDLKDPNGAVFDGADSDGLRDYAAGKHKAKSPGTAK